MFLGPFHMPPSFFACCLLSDTRYSRLIRYFPRPSPVISDFSKEPRLFFSFFFFLEQMVLKPNSRCYICSSLLSHQVTAKPSRWIEVENVWKCECVHAHTLTVYWLLSLRIYFETESKLNPIRNLQALSYFYFLF